MFEDEPPASESDEERSARHALMVRQAVLFCVLLILMMTALSAVGLWVVQGVIDVERLVFFVGLVSVVLPVGMYFELRKRW